MNEHDKLKKIWEEIKYHLLTEDREITGAAYETWIDPLKLGKIENNTIYFLVPEENAGDGVGINIIKNNYTSLFKYAISEKMKKTYNIEFVKDDPFYEYVEEKGEGVSSNLNISPSPQVQLSNLNPSYTFDTFVVGPNNNLAVSAAKAVVEKPGYSYNPLFLYGGPGLGKTHLMHAIGDSIIKKYPSKIVRYVTSEKFTNEVIELIQNGGIQRHRDIYRSVDVLLLDDIQFIIGKESTQNEFFNSFNELYFQNKAIILSSDKPPKDLEVLDERMRSRFEMGLTVDITPPDYETRMAILRQYAAHLDFAVEDEVIQYIASNIHSNIRELEGALNKVHARNKLINEKITVAVAEDAIKDMLKDSEPRRITPDLIISEVANFYGISKDTITSKKRTKEIVIPRKVSMYLCRELTDSSFDEIGKFIGGKDHSTVMHGYSSVAGELSTNPTLKEEIEKIRKKIMPPQ